MDNIVKRGNEANSSRTHPEYIPAASHYALKLAFQALKERCDKLQNRLTIVEENRKLKETVGKKGCSHDDDRATVEVLENKLDELTRQKAKVCHHIFVLANENKTLWDSLSKLTEEKQILLEQLREVDAKLHLQETDKNKSDTASNYKDHDVCPADTTNNCSQSVNDPDEEAKDSLQSIETVKELPLVEERLDKVELNFQLKDLLDKLNEDRSILQQQQARLKKTLDVMKKMYIGMKKSAMYLEHIQNDQGTSIRDDETQTKTDQLLQNLQNVTSSYEELISDVENITDVMCPFCNNLFAKLDVCSNNEQFNTHYLQHVQQCSELDMTLKSFEVIG